MSFAAIAFYIMAHQDDWEAFRGEFAYGDAHNTSNKIVFIHTTAGDAGQTTGWWEAREAGAISAVRSALRPMPLTSNVQSVHGHPLQRYVSANTVVYFMRLPDGSPGGTGYPSTGFESLSLLRDSNKPIVAVDGSTSYRSWTDFCDTLSAIVDLESQGVAEDHPWINAADYAPTTNPGDHADHKATSDAVRTFASSRFNRAWFLTYSIQACAADLSGGALTSKKATFDAYSNEVLRVTTLNGAPVPPNQEEWDSYGARSYARLVTFGQPDPDNPPPASGCPSTGGSGHVP